MNDTKTPAKSKAHAPQTDSDITTAKLEELDKVAKRQETIDKLTTERQQLDERLKDLQTLQTNAVGRRKTREQILIGVTIQKKIDKGELTEDWLRQALDTELTLKRDREVFGLPELVSKLSDVEIKEIPTEVSSNPVDKKINKKSPKVQTEGAVV